MSFRDRDPVVTPLDVKPNPSHPEFVIVSVRCPHCDGIHTHGARLGQDPGHRVSHCHGTGYFIRNTNTLTMPENRSNTMTTTDTIKSFAAAPTGWTVHMWIVDATLGSWTNDHAVIQHHTDPLAGWLTIERNHPDREPFTGVVPAVYDECSGSVVSAWELKHQWESQTVEGERVIFKVTAPGQEPESDEQLVRSALDPFDLARFLAETSS